MRHQTIKDVQNKILETMKFIDKICRDHGIVYYIIGGTAIGAILHGGFIPWDDDLDIFMTPENYEKFKKVFHEFNSNKFVLQEWKIVDAYLGYAKVRMNGTTFIEKSLKNRKDMHHGIYVDILMLYKCPTNLFIQKVIYYASKYTTLVALSQRNWKPKTRMQKLALGLLKILPNKLLSTQCYKWVYKYGNLINDFTYCEYLSNANFKQGRFDRRIFEEPIDVPFEDTILMGPTKIKKYLKIRYGHLTKILSPEQQKAAMHVDFYDTEVGFEKYI